MPPADRAPYVAVIFTSQLDPGADATYLEAAERMEQLAAEQPGFLGVESARGDDGIGITVSYWSSDTHAREWKLHAEHLAVQATGRRRWYQWYRVRVATVEREYAHHRDRPGGAAAPELLHLALPDDWTAARSAGEYRVSTRGRSLDDEGFVHCATPEQVEAVANRFYGDVAELVVLVLDPDRLDADVRLEPGEPGSDELFPHVYGPIPLRAVTSTVPWRRGAAGWHRPDL